MSKKDGWSRLEEDDTTHRFERCVVLANDKIVAVIPKDTPHVDVYSRQTRGLKLCARLRPIGGGGTQPKRTSLAVKENTRSSVSLEVGLELPGKRSSHIAYELSVGAAFLKTTAGDGVEKLRVEAPCRFAVMPDFFTDDILIDASTIPVARAELPSENFLLHMMHGGEVIVMTVSESRDNDIGVALSEDEPRRIESSDVSYGKQRHVWIAILAEQGIWHHHDVGQGDADKEIRLRWKMPFAALWRVDWSTEDKLTDSWEMLLQHPEGKYVMQEWFGEDASEGQRFGEEFGDRDWNKPGRKRWNPVLGQFLYPCWIDNDAQGYLQPLVKPRSVGGGTTYLFHGPAIIYPLDRVKTAPFNTPIEKLTVVDLVRMTLGVGPCQYILDLEGQKRDSQGVATCYARDVINAIYAEGSQQQKKAVILEMLSAAVAFIRNVRERIDEYVEFGHETSAYLGQQKRLHPQHAALLDEWILLLKQIDELFEGHKEKIRTPEYAEQLAEEFLKDLNVSRQEVDTTMRGFTSVGGAQDGLVAACRMIVKVLRQRSGIAMAMNPELKEIAAEIRNRTRAMLRNPTPYEAPRH